MREYISIVILWHSRVCHSHRIRNPRSHVNASVSVGSPVCVQNANSSRVIGFLTAFRNDKTTKQQTQKGEQFMPSASSRVTTDHEEIRRWAEERGGAPSHVKRTGRGDDPGILRIDFPGYSGASSLEPVSWDEWFQKFDEQGLALLFQETTANGQRSNFNKIVSRETAQQSESGRGHRSASRGSRSNVRRG